MLKTIIIIVLFMLFLQTIFSFYQIKYYERFVKNLALKYRGENRFLYTEKSEKKINRTILVIIVDNNKHILDAYQYSGVLFFSKFKRFPEIIGLKMNATEICNSNIKKIKKDILLKILERC